MLVPFYFKQLHLLTQPHSSLAGSSLLSLELELASCSMKQLDLKVQRLELCYQIAKMVRGFGSCLSLLG